MDTLQIPVRLDAYQRLEMIHGTAFDIAGKNKADTSSFLAAIYGCLDIIAKRREYTENHKNPLKKMGSVVLAGAEDEKIDES